MIEMPSTQENLNGFKRNCGLFGPEKHYKQVRQVHGLVDHVPIKMRGQYKE